MYSYRNPAGGMAAFFKKGNVLAAFILINAAVWLFLKLVGVILFLYKSDNIREFINLLALPAGLPGIAARPWTCITYMFTHYDFFHILFNMLWLYWFGRIFLEFLNKRQFIATYILGGLAGAAFYVASYNIFPVFRDVYLDAIALGASASVMAIVVAISFYAPNYSLYLLFFGQVRIKYIALVSIVLDLLFISSSNSGGHIAHLGGAAWGFLFAFLLRNHIDLTASLGRLRSVRVSNPFKKQKPPRKTYTRERPLSDEDYNYRKARQQERIDRILDKISRSGYDSLTKEEKEILFNSSSKK
jgi:membrane associated rhomboid family serine protease